jgi:hypothetical protein
MSEDLMSIIDDKSDWLDSLALYITSNNQSSEHKKRYFIDIMEADTTTLDLNQSNIMKEGDPCVIFEDMANLKFIVLKKNQRIDNRFGNFLHNEIIGKPYGCRVRTTF